MKHGVKTATDVTLYSFSWCIDAAAHKTRKHNIILPNTFPQRILMTRPVSPAATIWTQWNMSASPTVTLHAPFHTLGPPGLESRANFARNQMSPVGLLHAGEIVALLCFCVDPVKERRLGLAEVRWARVRRCSTHQVLNVSLFSVCKHCWPGYRLEVWSTLCGGRSWTGQKLLAIRRRELHLEWCPWWYNVYNTWPKYWGHLSYPDSFHWIRQNPFWPFRTLERLLKICIWVFSLIPKKYAFSCWQLFKGEYRNLNGLL